MKKKKSAAKTVALQVVSVQVSGGTDGDCASELTDLLERAGFVSIVQSSQNLKQFSAQAPQEGKLIVLEYEPTSNERYMPFRMTCEDRDTRRQFESGHIILVDRSPIDGITVFSAFGDENDRISWELATRPLDGKVQEARQSAALAEARSRTRLRVVANSLSPVAASRLPRGLLKNATNGVKKPIEPASPATIARFTTARKSAPVPVPVLKPLAQPMVAMRTVVEPSVPNRPPIIPRPDMEFLEERAIKNPKLREFVEKHCGGNYGLMNVSRVMRALLSSQCYGFNGLCRLSNEHSELLNALLSLELLHESLKLLLRHPTPGGEESLAFEDAVTLARIDPDKQMAVWNVVKEEPIQTRSFRILELCKPYFV